MSFITLWFTGLSGSGKTTLSTAILEQKLAARAHRRVRALRGTP